MADLIFLKFCPGAELCEVGVTLFFPSHHIWQTYFDVRVELERAFGLPGRIRRVEPQECGQLSTFIRCLNEKVARVDSCWEWSDHHQLLLRLATVRGRLALVVSYRSPAARLRAGDHFPRRK